MPPHRHPDTSKTIHTNVHHASAIRAATLHLPSSLMACVQEQLQCHQKDLR